MTSQINPSNINGAYPVAGQDNNSQGFRTNFTNTVNNFTYAASEITDLQNKAVLKSALTGTTLNNDMLGAPINNVLLYDVAYEFVPLGSLTGTVTLDYSVASYYSVTTGGNITLSMTNWPASGTAGVMSVTITVTSASYTVTFPASVSVNTAVQGFDSTTGIMSFAAAGVYTFTFTTVNGGTTVQLSENNKQLQPFNASAEVYANPNPVSLAVTTTVFPTGGTNQPTLADGVEGQIKVLVQVGTTPATITVTSYGWPFSGSVGEIELNAPGESCTLQFVSGAWYCIGSNGANFI